MESRQIEQGQAALDHALALGGRGPYVIQAAIAALHTEDPRDWEQIVALYDELTQATDSPVVALARAVAVAETRGPAAALELIEQIDLKDYRYLDSTRAGACCAGSGAATRQSRHIEARSR